MRRLDPYFFYFLFFVCSSRRYVAQIHRSTSPAFIKDLHWESYCLLSRDLSERKMDIRTDHCDERLMKIFRSGTDRWSCQVDLTGAGVCFGSDYVRNRGHVQMDSPAIFLTQFDLIQNFPILAETLWVSLMEFTPWMIRKMQIFWVKLTCPNRASEDRGRARWIQVVLLPIGLIVDSERLTIYEQTDWSTQRLWRDMDRLVMNRLVLKQDPRPDIH